MSVLHQLTLIQLLLAGGPFQSPRSISGTVYPCTCHISTVAHDFPAAS